MVAHALSARIVERHPHSAFARRMVLGRLTTFPPAVRDELSRGATWAALALQDGSSRTVGVTASLADATSRLEEAVPCLGQPAAVGSAGSPPATCGDRLVAPGVRTVPDTEVEWSAGLASRHPRSPLTPDLDRGVGVPPGYALVRCAGRLSVGVVVDRERAA